MSHLRSSLPFFVGLMAFCVTGCVEALQSDNRTWQTKMGWSAADYFEDPQVVALCNAIEANDVHEIDRLVDAGADVNAKGKGNMTPLLWAFPDNKLKRFTRLLEHGADPNVVTKSDFGVPQAFHAGDSVTHMAARTAFPGYFEAVLEYGGDLEITDSKRSRTLLHTVITSGLSDAKGRVRLLIEKGADLDRADSAGVTPVTEATTWFSQFDIALLLLKAGANPGIYEPNRNQKLVHHVERARENLSLLAPEHQQAFYALEKWLREHGEDFEQARKDNERWSEWGRTLSTKAMKRLREREVAERIARENAESEKQEDAGDKMDATADAAVSDEGPEQK